MKSRLENFLISSGIPQAAHIKRFQAVMPIAHRPDNSAATSLT